MNQETRNFENEKKILDSGARREFASGAVRDIQEGKGRCDLLPLDVIGEWVSGLFGGTELTEQYSAILDHINFFLRNGRSGIGAAITLFCEIRGWEPITAILEVSKHYEEGAKKYEERNWEKGIPAHCYVDSGVRHFLKYIGGWDDEPHDRAFLWNMFCLLWTIKHKPELNDLPYTKEQGTTEERGTH